MEAIGVVLNKLEGQHIEKKSFLAIMHSLDTKFVARREKTDLSGWRRDAFI